MSSGKYFAGAPSINIPRSKWKTGWNVAGTFPHGKFVPIDAIPVIAGDGHNIKLKDLTRMQTPIAPIFGNIKQSFAAWFIPLRLVWEHAEEFFGANKTSAGYQTTTYTFPIARFSRCDAGSPSHYLGKPYKASSETDANGKSYYLANILKERCYYLVWNEYMRPQQITNPVLVNLTDSVNTHSIDSKVGTWNGNPIRCDKPEGLMNVAKQFDYFTACTLAPQYGAAVELPLGTTAPVINASQLHDMGNSLQLGKKGVIGTLIGDQPLFRAAGGAGNGSKVYTAAMEDSTDQHGISPVDQTGSTWLEIDRSTLVTDLQHATAAKINDIRYAFAIQKYLERANFAGNYYFGILQVHYGVTSPDSRLQRPEFLGMIDEDILIHQVVATADTVNSGVKTSVGNTGAMSVTASGDVYLFDKAFVEPGYILICRWCKQRQVYSQGIMREDFKSDRFELYTPELCNLGDQSVLTRELYWKAGESEIFGFQEHWGEYRYRNDRVTSMLDPNVPNSLEFFTLANKFISKPELDDDFIFENAVNLERALTTGNSIDHYIFDTYIEDIMTREMPVRTIPGLIDHFGAM